MFPTPTCSFLCNSPGTRLLYLSSGDPQFLILQMFQMSKKSKLSSATSAGYTLYKLLLKSKLGKRKLWKELQFVDILCPFSDDAVGRKFQKTGVTQQLKILGLFLQHFLQQNFPITFPSPPLLPAQLKSIILVLPRARVRYLCGMVGKRKWGTREWVHFALEKFCLKRCSLNAALSTSQSSHILKCSSRKFQLFCSKTCR